MIIRLMILWCMTVLGVSSASAEMYYVEPDNSTIKFSGEYAGAIYSGEFKRWSAKIDFDFATPSLSKVEVIIDMLSAVTGNKEYDTTLPQQGWFDAAVHPRAVFRSQTIKKIDETTYSMIGYLEIKGINLPHEFKFRMNPNDPNARRIRAIGSSVMSRVPYNIGTKADPDSEWVGEDINVTFDIVAQKQAAASDALVPVPQTMPTTEQSAQ